MRPSCVHLFRSFFIYLILQQNYVKFTNYEPPHYVTSPYLFYMRSVVGPLNCVNVIRF